MSLDKKVKEAQVLYYSMKDLECENFDRRHILSNAYINGERSENIVLIYLKGYKQGSKLYKSAQPIVLL